MWSGEEGEAPALHGCREETHTCCGQGSRSHRRAGSEKVRHRATHVLPLARARASPARPTRSARTGFGGAWGSRSGRIEAWIHPGRGARRSSEIDSRCDPRRGFDVPRRDPGRRSGATWTEAGTEAGTQASSRSGSSAQGNLSLAGSRSRFSSSTEASKGPRGAGPLLHPGVFAKTACRRNPYSADRRTIRAVTTSRPEVIRAR